MTTLIEQVLSQMNNGTSPSILANKDVNKELINEDTDRVSTRIGTIIKPIKVGEGGLKEDDFDDE